MDTVLRSCLFFLICGFTRSCNRNEFGNITRDLDMEVNSTLTIQCSLFRSPIVYENKSYDVSSRSLRLKFGEYYLEDVKILDDMTIEYSVQSAQENDSGLYSCYLSLPEINRSFIFCTWIAVGYKPLPVQNFSCISYEYYNLTCSWKNPHNPVDTNYSLHDILLGYVVRECPEKLNKTACRWTMDTDVPYYRDTEKLNFFMIGKNSLGEIKQYMTIEDHYKIVLPSVPRDVRITNFSKTSLDVLWSSPRHMEYGSFAPGLQYSILYKPTSHEGKLEEIRMHSDAGTQVKIENLIPHTGYLVRVRCRSSVVDTDDMWSPEARSTAGTEPDVPYLAPEINPSSFEIEESILGNRTIILYWKGVPEAYENGVNFSYEIQYRVHHVSSRIDRHRNDMRVCNRTVCSFPHLDIHSAYLFKLYAVNKMGSSRNSSQIVVDKSEKLLQKPKDIVVISYGQGIYNLSWKTSNQGIYNFTIFWCKSLNPRPYKCEGELKWTYTNKTNYVLQLPNKNSYQFAVSASNGGYISGMSWASCIVYHKEVKYKVKKVEITLKTATSLKIQWSLECEAQKTVMKEYNIEYCEYEGPCSQTLSTQSCTDWKTVNVSDASIEDYILGSLKPYTHYLAFIRVRTLSGWSDESNVACKRTKSAAPSDAPRNMKVVKIEGKSVTVSFEPPQIPNGIITRYIVFCNNSDGTSSYHQEYIEKEIIQKSGTYTILLADIIKCYYTNYSIELMACVDQACSEKSRPVYAITEISNPGITSSPRVENNANLVNISWNDPDPSNGPLDYYQVLQESNKSVQIFNVSGQNYLLLNHSCTKDEDGKAIYSFRVRAVNIDKNGFHLLGPNSAPTKTMLCPAEAPIGVIVGIVIGSTAVIIIVSFLLYCLISWLKNEVDMIKDIQIQLPKDLDSPTENPLSSHANIKSRFQTRPDSGILCDASFEQLCEFASDDVKEVDQSMGENPLSSHANIKSRFQTRPDSGILCDTFCEQLCEFASDDVKDVDHSMEEARLDSGILPATPCEQLWAFSSVDRSMEENSQKCRRKSSKSSDPKKASTNGYVSFRDTLSCPSAETSRVRQVYSKFGMTTVNEKPLAQNIDLPTENGVIINGAELQLLPLPSQTSYVSFRIAKVMDINDSLNKDESLSKVEEFTIEDSENKVESLSKEDSLSKETGVNNLETEQNSLPIIVDHLIDTLDFSMSKSADKTSICINLENMNIISPSTYSDTDIGVSSTNDLSAEGSRFCKRCDNFAAECVMARSYL